MSRSGGMTTEISSTLTAAGLGESTAVSIGGDAIIGSTYAELMPLFEADEQTEAIVIYTEPGGRMEAAARATGWPRTTRACRSSPSWPAASWTTGMQGMCFGHAGTIVEGKEDTADREDRAPRGRGHPGGRADRRDPRRRASEKLGGRVSLMPGTFIDVEVDDAVRGDAELAKKLEEACPVDIFAATDERRGDRARSSSTSACSAGSASTPRRPARCRVIKLYDGGAVLERAA